MRENENILKQLDFDDFIKDINGKNLSKEQYQFVKNEITGKIQIDSIYFSGNYASIYFKSILSFDAENLKHLCQLHKTIWNQRKVPFLYVSTPTELRVYNCYEEPLNPDKELDKIGRIELARYSIEDTEKHLQSLFSILGRAAIDNGTFLKNETFVKNFNISKRVDNILVQNLKAAKLKLVEKHGIPIPIIHDLLTRSLFVLYLEDIGATNKEYYQKFKHGASSYFHILTDIDATYNFYKELEIKFNGDLFYVSEIEREKVKKVELGVIASCFWGDQVDNGQLTLWKKFDFSVIPIELLSEIYEIFLNKSDKQKSENGEYYTPHSLVDLILNESLPWASEENQKHDLKILDLACGSGIFLVESYRRLVDRWKFAINKQPEFNDLKNILLNSIYGFEINQEAIKVAAFSLYLALISYLDPKTIWQKQNIKFPYLINEPNRKDGNKQGKNLFRKSSLSNTIEHQTEFDLVLGNPPFKSAKTGSIEKEASKYCKKYDFAQEMVLPFLHKAIEFCSETGSVSIISTSKILFNKSGGYQNFRKFLFNDNYVETVFNFSALRKPKKGQGRSVFANAVGPACVLFYKKNEPENQKQSITYVCPKPTERDLFSDDLVLDILDFYYLPRNECQKPDTIIWKTAMWGTDNDYQLIQNLINKKALSQYLTEKNGWYKGVGFKFLTPTEDNTYSNDELSKFPVMEAKSVQRHFTNENLLIKSINTLLTDENKKFYLKHYNYKNIDEVPSINIFRALGNINTYFAPHLLIKRGQSNKKFCASYLNYNCSFKHAIFGISFNAEKINSDEKLKKDNVLKALTAYFNSKFTSYYLFLTTISWGVEREEVSPNEMLSLPALPFEIPEEQVNELAQKVDEISKELSKDFRNNAIIERIEDEIDEIIYKSLNLTQREKYLIEDVLNYSLDLFQEGENSPAYFPINQNNDELNNYLKILCEDINEHFEFSGTSVWASIQEMPATNPMRLIAIHFTNEHKAGHIELFTNSSKVNKLIQKIDKYSYEKHSASVYFRKVVRYYEGNIIYIIKPNQKRFWSRSQAMQDSSSVLLEMANMSEA